MLVSLVGLQYRVTTNGRWKKSWNHSRTIPFALVLCPRILVVLDAWTKQPRTQTDDSHSVGDVCVKKNNLNSGRCRPSLETPKTKAEKMVDALTAAKEQGFQGFVCLSHALRDSRIGLFSSLLAFCEQAIDTFLKLQPNAKSEKITQN